MIDAAAVAAIERSAREALPAAREIAAGDWMVRVSGGATKRVNSANPTAPGARVGEVIDVAERTYRAAGQPVRFRLTPLADPGVDATLAALGYARIEESLTMTATTAGHAPDPAVTLDALPGEEWCAAFAAVSGWGPGEDECHRSLLRRVERVAVATLREDGRPVGFGVASIAHGRACLFSIATHEAARGRGVARRLVGTLLGWAAREGAPDALLQVLATNMPARRLYEGLGFADAYPYHYRIAG